MPIRRATAECRMTGGILLALALCAGCSMFGDDGVPKSQRPSNGWQIEFSETAQSDGSIEFLVAPVGASSTTVSVPVGANQTDNEIAAVARGAFESSLGGTYKVVKDRDATVHISKASRQQPPVASGVRIRVTSRTKFVRNLHEHQDLPPMPRTHPG